jgi:hypothetical protein
MSKLTYSDGRPLVLPKTGFSIEAYGLTIEGMPGFYPALVIIDYLTEEYIAHEKVGDTSYPTEQQAVDAAQRELDSYNE